MVSEEQNSDIELASEIVPVPQVQPEVETQNVIVANVETNETNDISRRKPRQRKKVLHASIVKQMEFYFSDSNLSKDRFLAGLIKENPDVDIEIFMKCNKIRSLTTDANRVAKALKNSTMLQVSEDGTKVRRITPIIEKQHTDECTVYVQRLPSDADHEWLINLFSEYGPVAYVSIPKFKFNHKIKGFAFVEFDTPEGAEKCLKAFRAKGCELPSQTTPTELLSITTFSEEDIQKQNGTQISEQSSEKNSDTKITGDIEKKLDKSSELEKVKSKKKRRKSMKSDDPGDSGTDQSDSTKCKKKRNNDDNDTSACSDSNVEAQEKRGKKRKNRSSMEGVHNSDTDKRIKIEEPEIGTETDSSVKNETKTTNDKGETAECSNEEGESAKKKKKKRKRKRHSAYDVLETVDMGLQIMSKKDWKRLRNKYLELQRSKMKQLKQHIRKARWNQWGDRNKMETEQEEISNACNKKENPASKLEFTPAVIVKIKLNEACVDPKGFKAELKSTSNNIKYIDIKEGSNEAFVRCDSSDSAKALALKSSDEKSFKILTGQEEKSYWDKILRDREEKIGNKVRVKQRGRDKLLKKAEKELGKHIKFDED